MILALDENLRRSRNAILRVAAYEVAARAKQNISRARSSAVILAFMAGAAALLGAIAAWTAAVTGGSYRDGREAIPTLWDWGRTPEVRRSHSSTPR
jgi:hypothetical protein